MYANGTLGTLVFSAIPISFVLLSPVLANWQSFHFHCVQIALHYAKVCKHIHSVHHRNVNTGRWSGVSMHPVEHLGFFSAC